jgi:DNA-binding NarL/FixJ family response regulator
MITTVTIIEDDRRYAKLLKEIIDKDEALACMAIYYNCEAALTGFNESPTDLIIMDIQLPDGNGIDLTAQFKKMHPSLHIVMNTSFDDDERVFNSLKVGANGYVIKMDDPDNIVVSIKEVLQGGAPMSMSIARKVVEYFNKQELKVERLEELSDKENELLYLLSKGLLYKEIGKKMNIAMNTVKKHCGNIYRKLQVNNRTEAIILLNKKG